MIRGREWENIQEAINADYEKEMGEYRRGECKRKEGIETAGIAKQKISKETNGYIIHHARWEGGENNWEGCNNMERENFTIQNAELGKITYRGLVKFTTGEYNIYKDYQKRCITDRENVKQMGSVKDMERKYDPYMGISERKNI